MATRGAENTRPQTQGSTDFHVHISQRVNDRNQRPFDFTEHRIQWMHALERDPQKRLMLTAMLVDYRAGFIAISWRSGEPVYLKVTRDVK